MKHFSLCANIKNDATANLPESKFAMEYVSSQLKSSATHPKKQLKKSQVAQTDDKPKGLNACFWMYAEPAYKNHWSLVCAAS